MSGPKTARANDIASPGAGAPGPAHGTSIDPFLLATVIIAAALRFVALGSAPPGINQDEALSAWNGWCLLSTGHALSGEPWPIFYTRNIGDFPTTLFFYVLMPFQKLFGLSVWSTRLPAALAGVLAVVCAWDLGRRLAGPNAGRWAAVALALAPWSIFLGHFGTGASLGPLQALLPLNLLARSGLFPASGEAAPRRGWAWALAAGLAFGLGTYGFHSLRLQLPLTLAAVALVSPSQTRRAWLEPSARAAWLSLAAGFVLTFAPLAVVSFTDPDSLHRWQMTRLCSPGTPCSAVLTLIAERFAIYFSPDFLWVRGDRYSMLNPARLGALTWWMLPGFVFGAIALLLRAARDAHARMLLALLLLYPVGDLLSANDGVHSLRSAAGLPALALVIGVGTANILSWAQARGRGIALAVLAALLLGIVTETARFGIHFFRDAPRDRTTQIEYQAALLEAGRWLAEHRREGDPVFCTTTGMNQPFAVLLVALRYDAARWRKDAKEILPGDFDRFRRVGDLHFIYDTSAQQRAAELEANGQPDRAWFIVRPGELSLSDPVARFRAPDGEEMLWVCSQTL